MRLFSENIVAESVVRYGVLNSRDFLCFFLGLGLGFVDRCTFYS